ncbi:hypothetical protein, partial [Treponema sp. R8-4-B8]
MAVAVSSHNRSVNASPPYGGSGFRSARSPEGSHASLHPHFFVPEKPLRGFLIGRKKTSFTAKRYA